MVAVAGKGVPEVEVVVAEGGMARGGHLAKRVPDTQLRIVCIVSTYYF